MVATSTLPIGAARPPSTLTHTEPVRATQHIFRVVLDALANPGTCRQSIVHPHIVLESTDVHPYAASVLLALLDHEVSLHIAPFDGDGGITDLLVRRTRTRITSAGEATFVLADAKSMDARLPEQLMRGSLDYPDDGATLVITVPSLDQDAATGLYLALTGPGIRTEQPQPLRVPELSASAVNSRNRAVAHYPTGIDLLIIDDEGRIVGLPRTTVVTSQTEGSR